MDVVELVNVLAVEADGEDRFIGSTPASRNRPIFGGQFLGQSVMAASGTVDPDRLLHSMHGYFLRSGNPKAPITYAVERVRDGRGFSQRRVVATQPDAGGSPKEVYSAAMSFQVPAEGAEFQVAAPPMEGDPAGLPSYLDWLLAGTSDPDHESLNTPQPLDMRLDHPADVATEELSAGMRLWVRMKERLPDDPALHRAALAWASDKSIGDNTVMPHGARWTDEGADTISLDHAMWFHRPFRADEWLLFTQRVTTTSSGRGLATGEFHTPAGVLVASAVQEGLAILPD